MAISSVIRSIFRKGRRFFIAGGWVATGQVLSALGAMATIRIMTDLLTPDSFGRLTLLVGSAALALGISATPQIQAMIRFYPEAARGGYIVYLRRIVARPISILVALVALALSAIWMLATPWLGGPWFTGVLIAMLLIFDVARSFEVSLFNAARRQRAAAMIYTADAWSRPIMAVAAILVFGADVNSALIGYVMGSALVVAVMRTAMRLEGRTFDAAHRTADYDRELVLPSAIRRYAAPLLPLGALGWLSGLGDRYLIAGLLNLHDAGLYAAAYSLASRPFLMLSGIVELTMRPVLQNAIAAGDASLIARAKTIWLSAIFGGALLGVLAFVLMKEWVSAILLAPQYHSATNIMPVIALGYALYNVATVYTRFCYAFDDTKAVSLITLSGVAAGFVVLFPAVGAYALAGAAAAVPTRFAIELAAAIFLARRAERRLGSPRVKGRDSLPYA